MIFDILKELAEGNPELEEAKKNWMLGSGIVLEELKGSFTQ